MKMKRPGLASTLWFLAFAGVSYLYWQQLQKPNPTENDIIFGQKFYFDHGESVYVTGTLTGEGMAYPNNTAALTCYKERKECIYTSVEAIGSHQIGRMDAPWIIPIIQWDNSQIVASDEMFSGCRRLTITVLRRSQEVAWVEEPINQSKGECVKVISTITKYTIEHSPGYKKTFGH
jgi:hypothetical protein